MGSVTLHGGPAHNMRIVWEGGDTILIPHSPGKGYSLAGAHGFPSTAGLKTAMYVRSRRDQKVYVYQPE